MRIYLAGPMRGLPQFNFPAFDAGAETLEALGHTVFNPADRDRESGFNVEGMTGHEDLAGMGFSLREALQADTEFISLHAEAVALLPGWQKSSGVAAEIALAHALGLPVGELADFSKGGPTVTLVPPHAPSGTIESAAELIAKVKEGEFSPNQARVKLGLAHGGNGVASSAFTRADWENAIPALPAGEIRTTSTTGGEKGTKPERYDLIPVGALSKVAALYGRGAAKYAAHNWRKGYEWSKSYAALQRHATQFWNGEDNDPEMGLPHMASVAFHALALLTFMEEQPGFDDRYTAAARD